MGKVVKTVLKVAAVAAIAVFAPPLAAAVAPAIGVSGALGMTALTAGIGAGMGKLIPGVSTTEGLFAAGMSGAGKAGLLGGTSPTATVAGTTPTTTAPIAGATPGAAAPAAAAPAAAAAAPATQGGLGAALGGGLRQVGNVLTQGLSAAAPQMLAAGLTTTPGAGLVRAQQAELQRAQQVNAALTQQRMDQANKLIEEAAYYDPEYMARQAAEAAMIRGGIQETEATRGLTGERRAAEERRIRLGTARSAGTAYQQGYGTGVGARTQTRQAGIQAMPTQYPTTTAESSSAMQSRMAAREARLAEEQGLAALFGQVLGRPATT